MVKNTNTASEKFQMPHSAIKIHENQKSPYGVTGERVGSAVKRLSEKIRWAAGSRLASTGNPPAVTGFTVKVPGNIIQEALRKTPNCCRGGAVGYAVCVFLVKDFKTL